MYSLGSNRQLKTLSGVKETHPQKCPTEEHEKKNPQKTVPVKNGKENGNHPSIMEYQRKE